MQNSVGAAMAARDERIQAIMGGLYWQPEHRRKAWEKAAARGISSSVLEVLKRQNSTPPGSSMREQNLRLLEHPGTVVLCTGQQTGLFMGPLLTYYKALTAVRTAKALSNELGAPVVPLFWLQTEDHDFEEIRECWSLGPGEALARLAVSDTEPGSRRSVYYRLLGTDVEDCLAALERLFQTLPHGPRTMALLRRHYRRGRRVTEAFAGMLADVFAEDGLLLFDPRGDGASRLMSDIFLKSLEKWEEISSRLISRNEELEASGFQSQVHVRERSPLFFVHSGSPDGERFRLEYHQGQWHTVGGGVQFNDSELRTLIKDKPELISSSALLRPIMQDSLFPSTGYVGGPAELNYFAQISPLFSTFDLPQPLVIPRLSALCLEPRPRRILERLGLSGTEIARTETKLASAVAERRASRNSVVTKYDEFVEGLRREMGELELNIAGLEPTLRAPYHKSSEKIAALLKSFRARLSAAAARAEGLDEERLDVLEATLRPRDEDQERVHSLPYYLARYGSAFRQAIEETVPIYEARMTEVHL